MTASFRPLPAHTLRSAEDLAAHGLPARGRTEELARLEARYATAVTPHYAGLIQPDDPADPLAAQFLPDARELDILPHERADPIGDAAHSPLPGIVHRYPDRVLLKATQVCPVYCRFCFRREMVGPGKGEAATGDDLDAALDYIAGQTQVREVILTGGDPMMLSAERAARLTARIEAIAHVRVIRWHTRMPVADPARVTAAYAEAIAGRRCAVFVAIHANHSREFSPEAVAACRRLAQAGVAMLGQSVLLAGVNDTLEALTDLMWAFVGAGVKPYYLHHPDLAPGTSHFRLPVEKGRALVQALRDTASGLCQPTYVLDIPGGVSKAVLTPEEVTFADGATRLRGRDGHMRTHDDPAG